MAPRRIELSRRRGWRKPAGAVVVARPSKWGNPFAIDADHTHAEVVERYRAAVADGCGMVGFDAADVRRELAGRDLACWCPLVDADGHRVPCHADMLLELANPGWRGRDPVAAPHAAWPGGRSVTPRLADGGVGRRRR